MIFGFHPNTVRCACLFPLLVPLGASFGFAASHEAAPAPTPLSGSAMGARMHPVVLCE